MARKETAFPSFHAELTFYGGEPRTRNPSATLRNPVPCLGSIPGQAERLGY